MFAPLLDVAGAVRKAEAFSAALEKEKRAMNIIPVEYKVLVQLESKEKVTAGGIVIPDMRHERDQMAQTKATLVAVGGNAFSDWEGPIPQVGDKVLITKYAGERPDSNEENPLRLCMDKDVCAILKE